MRRILASTTALVLSGVCCLQSALAADSSEHSFLLRVQRDSARYFWEQASPYNGLIKDSSDEYSPSSIAAVGFGLAALCLMEKHGWKSEEAVKERLIRLLRVVRDRVEHVNGFFYHFVSTRNGKRVWKSEASSVDTAILVAGALFAGEYFKGTEVERLANQIYERVNWPWMMNGRNIMSMGYTPEKGFLPYYWDSYNEGMLLYALAIGSPTHPISKDAWWAWKRPVTDSEAGSMVYCQTGSLFVYQYPHAFIDFRGINDGTINYWQNSVKATLANRFFCIQNKAKFKTYEDNIWGLTASLGPDGYKGYGAEPGDSPYHDGTVSPSAAAGSLPFVPGLAANSLKAMYGKYGDKVYGRYGFYDAFNVDKNWWANSYIGINQGITVLMIENMREDTVWSYFMKNPAIRRWAATCMSPVGHKTPISSLRNTIPPALALADMDPVVFKAPFSTAKRKTVAASLALANW